VRPLAALVAVALLIYPLLFYLLYDRTGLAGTGVLLGALVLGRLIMLDWLPRLWRCLAAVAVFAFLAAVWRWHSEAMLKLYPVAVNAALLGYAVYTLWRPPSAIERLMQALRNPVSDAGRGYARAVTIVWGVFFAVNGGIAAYTALAAPTAAWAVYNGVLSYLAAGLLFGVEYLFRGYYRRRLHGTAGAARR
jgi:uncharacterized membrane protein